MAVFIRFEDAERDELTPEIGPFLWIQATRDFLRASETHEDNGDVEFSRQYN